MFTVFAPFVKEILDYAWTIAQQYNHAEVTPTHTLLAMLKHPSSSYVREYIASKKHLVVFEHTLLTQLSALPALHTPLPAQTEGGYAIDSTIEMVIKEAYTEAKSHNAEMILLEYFFLTLLKKVVFEGLDYEEARLFINQKNAELVFQHQEIAWGRQGAWLSIAKGLDAMYEAGKTTLKPYLHQVYHQSTGNIRLFVLLIDLPTKAHKITIELIEKKHLESAKEQTLRFLNHRKYPITESFLYAYDAQEWTKFEILPKEICEATEKESFSELLQVDFEVWQILLKEKPNLEKK